MPYPLRLAGLLCIGIVAAWPASAQSFRDQPFYDRGPPAGSYTPPGRFPPVAPLLQLDATALLEAPPPPREPPPQQRPLFSDGWTRDGFGGQPRGWR